MKMKLISLAALILGAVACKPLPVYPQTDGPRRPYPERPHNQGDPRPPYYGDQETIPPISIRPTALSPHLHRHRPCHPVTSIR